MTPEPTPGATPEPTPQPTEEPNGASILIAKVDNNGTADPDDDVFLDGASFALYLDDGDGMFEAGETTLVFGPAPTVDSMIDTDMLLPGEYWIVEAVVPAGFVGSDPILVELNTDPTITCLWDAPAPWAAIRTKRRRRPQLDHRPRRQHADRGDPCPDRRRRWRDRYPRCDPPADRYLDRGTDRSGR